MTRAWLAANRDRIVGELTISGLCEPCAGALIDDAARLSDGLTETAMITVCLPCFEKLCPPGAEAVFTLSGRILEEARRRGMPLGDEEALGLTCALVSGWRPGKEN